MAAQHTVDVLVRVRAPLGSLEISHLQRNEGGFDFKITLPFNLGTESVQNWKEDMKVCTKCGLSKDESEYSWSIRNIKKHSSCNSCRAIERMDYYERNKDKELKYKWERQVRKREEAREFVDAYKNTHPCVDCGNSDPDSLTFDHVRGTKKMNISQMVNQGYSIEALKDEMSKCEIRCWTCHMKAEKKRRSVSS